MGYKRHKRIFLSNYWTYVVVIALCGIAFVILRFTLIITDIDVADVTGIINTRHNNHRSKSFQNANEDYSPAWTRISDSIHVYSAHFDPRIKHGPYKKGRIFSSFNQSLSLIRIVGIKRFPPRSTILAQNPQSWFRIKDETLFNQEYECKLFLQLGSHVPFPPTTTTTLSSQLLTYHVIEEGIKKFAACFINCYFNLSFFPKQEEHLLNSGWVALVPKNVQQYPNKLLKIETALSLDTIKLKTSTSKNSSLAICVRPLFSSPNNPYGDVELLKNLIQFISYYVAMGVTTFNFYELSILPQVRHYLRQLRFRQYDTYIRFHVQRWNLPTGNTSELWDFGSLASLNDCLYRNMGADHVLFLDLDEFIVPQQVSHNSLQQLINYLEKGLQENRKKLSRPPAQLLFRNTFFCSEFCLGKGSLKVNQTNDTTFEAKFPIATCNTRTKRIWNVKLRSKFIVRPKNIISVGHHTSHNFWKRDYSDDASVRDQQRFVSSITADPGTALLYHYRECKPISTKSQPIFNRLTIKDEKLLTILKHAKFKWY